MFFCARILQKNLGLGSSFGAGVIKCSQQKTKIGAVLNFGFYEDAAIRFLRASGFSIARSMAALMTRASDLSLMSWAKSSIHFAISGVQEKIFRSVILLSVMVGVNNTRCAYLTNRLTSSFNHFITVSLYNKMIKEFCIMLGVVSACLFIDSKTPGGPARTPGAAHGSFEGVMP